MQPGGVGNLAQRISQAQNEINTNGIVERQKSIILFSAGEDNSSPSILDQDYILPTAPVNTFGYESSTSGQDLMGWLANETGGDYFEIPNSSEISNAASAYTPTL